MSWGAFQSELFTLTLALDKSIVEDFVYCLLRKLEMNSSLHRHLRSHSGMVKTVCGKECMWVTTVR